MLEDEAKSGGDLERKRLADLEFRIDQEREQFQLYERRRSEGELQATAVTAAALTFAALLIAGADKLAALGDVPRYGLAITLLALVVAMVFASVARFGAWGTAVRLGRHPARHLDVRDSLEALRAAEGVTETELRRLALTLWKARALSAWQLGEFKTRWLKYSAACLVVPLVFLGVVAVALVV